MKKYLIIFVCFLVLGCEEEKPDNTLVFDSNWETLPAPVAPDSMIKHDDVFFINESKGWLVTRNGQIYHTFDGGESWDLQFEDDIYYNKTPLVINDFPVGKYSLQVKLDGYEE